MHVLKRVRERDRERESRRFKTDLMCKGLGGFSLPAVDNDTARVWASVRLPAVAETAGDELGQVVELVFENFPERDVIEKAEKEKGQLKAHAAEVTTEFNLSNTLQEPIL